MKKMLICLFFFGMAIMGAGCSVGISLPEAEEFGDSAEALSDSIFFARNKLEQLEGTNTLSVKEQKLIVQQIDFVTKEIDDFKAEEAPFLENIPKKIVVKELEEKKKTLTRVREKAVNGQAKREDIATVLESLSEDLEISLFE